MKGIACAFLMVAWHGDYWWLTSPSAFYWPAPNGLGKWFQKESAKKKAEEGRRRVSTRP